MPTQLPDFVLTADVRHNLLLTLKEALNNIVKHAGATEVRIQVAFAPDLFMLTISDNGKGFQLAPATLVDATPAGETKNFGSGGNGLRNMRQRIESVGGQFELESRPNHGTRIKLTLRLRIP